MSYTEQIAGYRLDFDEEDHSYFVDGILVPSVTELLREKFGGKYAGVAPDVLKRAAERGTAVHDAIERFCKTGEMADLTEVRNFAFLRKMYGFEVLENEKPVILFHGGEPVAAGRLDLVLKMDGKIGGADIKRTSSLDKEYLAYQLNLYRIAYRQCYGVEWEFLRGVHLREDVRKFVTIPINEGLTMDFIKSIFEKENKK